MLGHVSRSVPNVRRVSAAIFNNEKAVEVLSSIGDQRGAFTATDISGSTGIAHGLVRAFLRRLTEDDVLLRALPKTGSSHGPQFYEMSDNPAWPDLTHLAKKIQSASESAER
jgi:hypothetical protein